MSTETTERNRAVEHVPAGQGRAFWLLTDLYVTKRTSEDTDGAFTLAEHTAAPQSPPAPHIHHREDETYYILEGEFEFLDEDRTLTAGAGSVVYLPKGRLHSHSNPGDSPARAVVFYTPGGVEKFIEDAGKPATDPTALPPPPDEADLVRLLAAAPKHGFEAPPPPE